MNEDNYNLKEDKDSYYEHLVDVQNNIEKKKVKESILKREKEFSGLLKASRAVLKYSDFKTSSKAIFDACTELIGVPAGYVALLTPDKKENLVVFLNPGGYICTVDPDLPMPIRGMRGEVVKSKKPLYNNSFPETDWLRFMPKGHVDLKNVLFTPLIVDDEVQGLMGMANKPGGFTEEDAKLAMAFTEFVSIALQNSQALESLEDSEQRYKNLSLELEQIVIERTKNLKDSEEKYRYLFDNAQVGLYWSGISDGKILECNDTFAKLFGYDTREECLAYYNTIEHYIDPNVRSEIVKEIRDKKEFKNYEIHVTRRDNTPIWLSISARMFEKENRIEGAAIDITERKRIENQLRSSEVFLSNVFTSIQDGISILDKDLNIIQVNPIMEKWYSHSMPMLGRKCYEVYHERSEPCEICPSIQALKSGEPAYEVVPKRGPNQKSIGWLDLYSFPLLDERSGQIIGVIEYVRDITERKQAERELQLERDNFLNILNSMEDGVYIVDQNYDINYVNPSLIKEFGQFEGMKCFNYFEDRNDICPRCKNREIYQGKTLRGEWFSFKNQKTYDLIDTPLKNPDGSISKLGILRDETGKKLAEHKLKSEKEKAQEYFDIAGVIIVALNADQTVQLINQKGCEILEEEESKIIGMNWFDNYIPENAREQVKEVFNLILSGEIEPLEYYENEVITKNGKKRIISWHNRTLKNKAGHIIGTLSSGLDITVHKQTEEKFRKQNVFLSNILESLTHPFYVINADDYTVALANFAASSEGLELGKYCYSLTHNNDKPCEAPCKCPLDEVKKTKRSCVLEHVHYDKEGNEKIYEIYGYPILDENGNVVQMIEYALNITDRKMAQRELRESEQKYRSLFENSPVALMDQDFSEMKKYVDHLKATGIKDFKKYFEDYHKEVQKFIAKVKVIDVNKKTMEIYKAPNKEDFISRMNKQGESLANNMTEEILLDNKKEILALINGDKMYESEVSSTTSLGDIMYLHAKTSLVSGFENTWSNVIVSLLNITEQKIAEKALKESEKKYRHLFESSPYFIGLVDENGTLVDSNSSISKFLSMRTKEDVIGKNILDILSIVEENKQVIPLLKKLFQEAYSNQPGKSHEFKLHRSTGGFLWLNVVSSTVEINNQKLVQFIVQDITNRKIIEEDLKESEIKFRTITEQFLMGIGILQDEEVKYANLKLANMYGYSVEEFIGKTYSEFLNLTHPEDRAKLIRQVEKRKDRTRDTGVFYQFRAFKKTGELFWANIYSRIINYQGKRAGLLAILDNTEMKIAELKLKESEEKFRKIAEQSFMGIIIRQHDNIKYVNDAAINIFGYPMEDVKEWSNEYITEKSIYPEDLPYIRENRRTERDENSEVKQYLSYRIITKSGKLRWVDQYSKIILYQGEISELITIVDITEKKEAERIIIEENKKLLELDKLRRDFLIRASHELKTPLNSVYSASEFLIRYNEEILDEKLKKFLEIIYKGGKRLKVLIENLLDVSRIESEKLQLNVAEKNISKIIKNCIKEVDYLAKRRNISIIFEKSEDIVIKLDKIRMEQVFVNILVNAIKNTLVFGEVIINTLLEKDQLKIIINDTGVGFTEEEKEKLFKKFGKIERYGQGMDIDTEGSGLGLFLSKEIVELHGGDITLQSQGRNKGSTFIIRLPL